jgi:hypothetical protein
MSNWNEEDHPRDPSGKSTGGQFTSRGSVAKATKAARKAAGIKGKPEKGPENQTDEERRELLFDRVVEFGPDASDFDDWDDYETEVAIFIEETLENKWGWKVTDDDVTFVLDALREEAGLAFEDEDED